jgi:enoyl-CoA hydratase
MAGSIRVEREGHIGWLIFDHLERRNAITVEMWREIPVAARQLATDSDVRVVVLRGAGDVAFVAGADISEFERARSGGESSEEYDQHNQAAYEAISSIEKPVIAMIHGFCIGGGLALALTADMRYAADDVRMGIPAARLGLGYGFAGIETLVRLLGYSRTKEIMFTAKRFEASEALRMGLVNAVFPKQDLEREVRKLADTIADNAPLTLKAAKLAVRALEEAEAHRDEHAVKRAIDACYTSEDYKEGVAAFLGKRSPRFQGR